MTPITDYNTGVKGLYDGTAANLIKTLQMIDGSTAREVGAKLFYCPSTIQRRINQLEKIYGGRVIVRSVPNKRPELVQPSRLTELGRKVLEVNKELLR